MNYLDKIDQVYVINLDRHKQRLKKFTQESKKLELTDKISRIKAIDGKKLTLKYKRKVSSLFCSYFCSSSLIACALSHKKTWKKALEKNQELVMICEDDCYFLRDFKEKFNKVFPLIPEDFDMVFLGGEMGCSIDEEYSWLTNFLLAFKKKKFKKINEQVYIPELALAAHCYILSRSGLEKLIQKIDKIKYHIDAQINTLDDFKIYAVEPKLAFQKTSLLTTSNVETKYPYFLNKYFEKIKDPDNRPYSYLFSIPIIEFFNFPVSAWMVIFFFLAIIFSLLIPSQFILFLFFIINLWEILLFPAHINGAFIAICFFYLGLKISNYKMIS